MSVHASRAAALAAPLRQLPPVQHAFAYGSGVLHQPGLYESAGAQPQQQGGAGGPMVDYFLAVEDPLKWHAQNISANPDHYSWVAKLGPKAIAGIAEHVGVGVHFNALVRMRGGEVVKYGVISTRSLLDDLRTWRHLYVAGRLQKPVLTLLSRAAEYEAAQQANLRAAAAAALLLLPPRFTTQAFLSQIVKLSYTGDIRMGIAEDPLKVERIVQGSRPALDAMYLPLICSELGQQPQAAPLNSPTNSDGQPLSHSQKESMAPTSSGSPGDLSTPCMAPTTSSSSSSLGHLGELAQVRARGEAGSRAQGQVDVMWERTASPDLQGELFKQLPPALLTRVAYKLGFFVPEHHLLPTQAGTAGPDTLGDIANAAVRSGRLEQLVSNSIADTVRVSSASQAVSGLLAAGGGKAVQYTVAKVAKALSGVVKGLSGAASTLKRVN